jgi:hypothetical protein
MTTGEDGEVLRDKIATILEEEFFDECAFDSRNCAKAVLELFHPILEENRRLRGEWEALDRIVTESIVENDGPDRIRWEGVWYDGPPAAAFLRMMRAVQKMARAALSPSEKQDG